MALRVLDQTQFVDTLRKILPPAASTFHALYISTYDAIITDPALMVLPMDDHMVHRGHAVFDTCNVVAGKAYGLDFHLDRLFKSMALAKITYPNPPAETKKRFLDIVLQTIAASQVKQALVRMWVSAGRGGFGIDPIECDQPTFIVLVQDIPAGLAEAAKGGKEVVVPATKIPLKPKLLATMKSTNYLLNALVAIDAREQGGHMGLQHDEQGFLTEGSVCCYGFVTKDRKFITPPYEKILRGTTLVQMQQLLPKLVKEGVITGYEQKDIHISTIWECVEVIQFMGGIVAPVTQLDDKVVGDGKPGPVFQRLKEVNDEEQLRDSRYLHDIPYHLYAAKAKL